METFDYGKALADMWAQGGKSFLEAQQQAFRAMQEGAAAGIAAPGAAPGSPIAAAPSLMARNACCCASRNVLPPRAHMSVRALP